MFRTHDGQDETNNGKRSCIHDHNSGFVLGGFALEDLRGGHTAGDPWITVTVTVMNNSGDTIRVSTSRKTRFVVRLPGNEPYVISFDQQHCLRKEVLVDATCAMRTGANMRPRKLAFEVVLDSDPENEFGYAGPVGSIGFQKGTGNLDIAHNYAMARVTR